MSSSSPTIRTKTILIAVGGPTCSGKTSLVKHLCKILPEGDSFIVHQDDFAPVSPIIPPSSCFSTRYDTCSPSKADRRSRSYRVRSPGWQPEADLPFHPDHPEWQDWDHPPTAIQWKQFHRSLVYSKMHAEPSPEVQSHDHLNVQKDQVGVKDEIVLGWKERFEGLKKELEQEYGERVVFGFVDGFLLFWDEVSRLSPHGLRRFLNLR